MMTQPGRVGPGGGLGLWMLPPLLLKEQGRLPRGGDFPGMDLS